MLTVPLNTYSNNEIYDLTEFHPAETARPPPKSILGLPLLLSRRVPFQSINLYLLSVFNINLCNMNVCSLCPKAQLYRSPSEAIWCVQLLPIIGSIIHSIVIVGIASSNAML